MQAHYIEPKRGFIQRRFSFVMNEFYFQNFRFLMSEPGFTGLSGFLGFDIDTL
jgi:hypothetical protein